MMTNLFSMFDPASPSFLSSNWLIILSVIMLYFIINNNLFIMESIKNQPMLTHFMDLSNVFTHLFKAAPYTVMLAFNYFMVIIILNWLSMYPFVFTATAQMSITLSLSLPIWVAANMYGWSFNTNNLLAHQIPQSTPWFLMPLMAMIELTSNLIRPITLTIRLTANLLAGHILLAILMSATLTISFYAVPLLMPIQYCLILLEILVGYIQAYVFATLILLYAAEMAS